MLEFLKPWQLNPPTPAKYAKREWNPDSSLALAPFPMYYFGQNQKLILVGCFLVSRTSERAVREKVELKGLSNKLELSTESHRRNSKTKYLIKFNLKTHINKNPSLDPLVECFKCFFYIKRCLI